MTMLLPHWTHLAAMFLVLAALAAPAVAISPGEEAAKADQLEGTLQRFDKAETINNDWGWIRWLINGKLDPNAEMTFGIVYIKPNQTNPAHIHPNSAEYLHVLEGSCEHMVGKKWVSLKQGDTLRIPKNVPHKARTGKQPCRAVLVYDTGERQFVEVKE